MVDRTDIDALLISALYGELTPADEARLTAHLESHPGDRTALADLTQTRAAVRDSRILAVQLEPSPSVSSLLLREAARRAPRPREEAGWFLRFTRSFMAHPAMAAAAMLVLVVGVAGTIYARKGDHFAAPTTSQESARGPVAASAPAAVPQAAAPSGEAALTDELASRDQQAAGSGSFGVDLAEGEKREKLQARVEQAEDGRAKNGDALLRVDQNGDLEEAKRLRRAEPTPAVIAPAATTPARKGSGGIELRGRELAPKDLDDKSASKKSDRPVGNKEKAYVPSAAAGPSGGLAAPVTVPASPPQEAPARPQIARDSGAPGGGYAKTPVPAPAKPVARSAAQKPEAPPPPPAAAPASETLSTADNRVNADPASDAKAEDKAVDGKLLAWAARQHRQVIALVGANKCREAAAAAVAIYNRAPDYYASSVATDRSIKPCLAYVTTEREREDRSRAAAKRAIEVDTPAASPATK